MNRREWVLYGQKKLEEAQIENASGDAWYLFSECFHISREDYLFGMTDEINDKEAEERYKELIQKRKEHVPLQYILGTHKKLLQMMMLQKMICKRFMMFWD